MSQIGPRLFAAVLALAGSGAVAQAQSAPAVFAQCAICHATTAGAPAKIGPTLAGVAGKPAASRPGFAYSDALKKSKLVWNDATLDKYLAAPMKVVPGTKMAFAGVADPAKRAAVVAYVKTLK